MEGLFNFLRQYPGVDVLTIGRYVQQHFTSDPVVIGIMLTEAAEGRGEDDGYGAPGDDTEVLHSLSRFCLDQSKNGCELPSPKVFVSGSDVPVYWLEEWISMGC